MLGSDPGQNMVGMGGLCGCGPGMDGGYVMVMPSVGGPESHWGVSRYLEGYSGCVLGHFREAI